MAGRRGYRTVSLPVKAEPKEVPVRMSPARADALERIIKDMSLYDGVKLWDIMEAIYVGVDSTRTAPAGTLGFKQASRVTVRAARAAAASCSGDARVALSRVQGLVAELLLNLAKVRSGTQ